MWTGRAETDCLIMVPPRTIPSEVQTVLPESSPGLPFDPLCGRSGAFRQTVTVFEAMMADFVKAIWKGRAELTLIGLVVLIGAAA